MANNYAVTTLAGSSSGDVDSSTGTSAQFNSLNDVCANEDGSKVYVIASGKLKVIDVASTAVSTLPNQGSISFLSCVVVGDHIIASETGGDIHEILISSGEPSKNYADAGSYVRFVTVLEHFSNFSIRTESTFFRWARHGPPAHTVLLCATFSRPLWRRKATGRAFLIVCSAV